MGSSQSSVGDRGRAVRWPSGSGGHPGQRKQKTRQSSGLTVNSGRQYEHLNCANDNSARSSPFEEPDFAVCRKDRILAKNDSSTSFCPCFRVSCNGKQLKRSDDTVTGQSSDSVALLRVSRCSDYKFCSSAEPGCDSSSYDEKLDHQSDDISSQEKLPAVGDELRITDEFRNGASSALLVSSCEDANIRPKTEMDFSDGWIGRDGNVESAQRMEQDAGFRNEMWLTKKYRSFLCNLSSHSKSKPVAERFSRSDRATESREEIAIKTNSELDYVSNAASYDDSGKASETETCLYMCDRGGNSKAPIAKIDSLETTSIDSLDSADLMLDTVGCSYTSVEKLGVAKSSEPPKKLIVPNRFFETGNLNPASARDHAIENTQQRVSLGDASIDTKMQRSAKISLSQEKESVSSVRFNVTNAAKEDLDSSHVFLESSSCNIAPDGECVVLNREAYSGIVSEVESCRDLLIHLSTLLFHEDYKPTSHCLQSVEVQENSPLIEKLTLENRTLKKQIVLLQTVANDQQDVILELRQKLDKMQNSMQKSDVLPPKFHSGS